MPHCAQATELLLTAPPEAESPVRKRAIGFTVIAVLILGGGLIAANIALKRAKRLQVERQQTGQVAPANSAALAEPFAAQGFRVSPVRVEQVPGSSLAYAVGVISNTSSQQRFGVKVELELQAADGSKVGGASDYQKVLEPGAEWKFRALVVDKRATVARVTSLKESQ